MRRGDLKDLLLKPMRDVPVPVYVQSATHAVLSRIASAERATRVPDGKYTSLFAFALLNARQELSEFCGDAPLKNYASLLTGFGIRAEGLQVHRAAILEATLYTSPQNMQAVVEPFLSDDVLSRLRIPQKPSARVLLMEEIDGLVSCAGSCAFLTAEELDGLKGIHNLAAAGALRAKDMKSAQQQVAEAWMRIYPQNARVMKPE